MPETASTPTRSGWIDDLRWAVHASGPVAMGYVPLGMALGALVVNLGLHWWLAPVMATAVYAGSMEFLLAGFLVSAPGLASVALATLAVNFRHVFYPLLSTGLSHPPSGPALAEGAGGLEAHR